MARFFKIRLGSKGSVPGSVVFQGEQKLEQTRIRVMSFDSNELIEKECETIEEAFGFIRDGWLTWINVDGIHDTAVAEEIGRRFQLHGLILEDFLNTDHRPKLEASEKQLFLILKLLLYDAVSEKIEAEQMSLIAGDQVVLTLQERVGRYFEPLRGRIRNTPNRTRLNHPDYLSYALIDCLVDAYMEILAGIGSLIDSLEKEVMHHPRKSTLETIYRYRSEMNFLRKHVWPVKEICGNLLRSKSDLIRPETREYLKDLNDHVIALSEAIEAYQLIIMDQLNVYHAGISNRANEIMKTLTIFASIFIPLTFVAGIYGMNFEWIPELAWKWGYPAFWGLVVLLGGGLLVYFKRKRWL